MLISGAETTSEWPLPVGLNPDLTRSEDEGLLEAIKHGTSLEGQEAFSVLYERHCLDVWRYILWRKEFSDAEAKDVFSEVWCRALSRIQDFVWQGTPIRYWLISIADRVCTEFSRKAQKEEHESLDEELVKQAQDVFEAEQILDSMLSPDQLALDAHSKLDAAIKKGMSHLNPKERKIIGLTYFKNLNSTQIAQRLKMKSGTVRVIRKRTLEKLAKHLSQEAGKSHD